MSGLVAPFPVFVLILAIFTHLHHGSAAAEAMMRGVILGSLSFAMFFVVAAVGLKHESIAATYVMAAVVKHGSQWRNLPPAAPTGPFMAMGTTKPTLSRVKRGEERRSSALRNCQIGRLWRIRASDADKVLLNGRFRAKAAFA